MTDGNALPTSSPNDEVSVISLYLDDPVLQGSAAATAAFQVTSEGLQLLIFLRHTGDDRYDLPTPPL